MGAGGRHYKADGRQPEHSEAAIPSTRRKGVSGSARWGSTDLEHADVTDSHHRLGVATKWLDGGFAANAPNQTWTGDITYVWTAEWWLYLAVILDLHSRRVAD